ncbi:MAG: NFACT RNA binding domain-containing protein [Spirochaetes bacterium]|nr:NFACT RNA binding domain-containing protein [Spirochaetota bacterium]
MINLNFNEINLILSKILITLFDIKIDNNEIFSDKISDDLILKNYEIILNKYNYSSNKIYVIDARQIFNDELYLQIRGNKKTLNLFIKISNNFNFIANGKPLINSPKNPFLFTLLLKKWIVGKKIEKIEIKKNDRIFYFYFVDSILVFEMLGRNGNIFLLDKENNIIGKMIKKESKLREEDVGGKYNSLIEKFNEDGNLDKESYDFKKFKIREEFSDFERVFEKYIEEIFNNFIKSELKKFDEKIIKIKKNIEKLNKSKKSEEDIEELKIKGDLLISNLENIKEIINKDKNLENIKLENFDGKYYNINIDRRKNLIQNANNYYSLYKEEKKKNEEINKYLIYLEDKLNKLFDEKEKFKEEYKIGNNLRLIIEKLKDKLDINIYKKLNNLNEKKVEKTSKKQHFYIFKSNSGEDILVGKSAKSNIVLIKKFCRGEDYWFHARDYQGAYVILKPKDKKSNISQNSIIDAAMLALYFSKGRNSKKGDVVYTKVKYLRFADKKSGKILYTNDKNIYIEIDENRIKILKENSLDY